jgi:hypothetical protein
MIPVMMYTSKEGEVYVGQARALGGIGVLPKEVHPQVLFDMLLKLGLVTDKRTATTAAPDAPRRRAADKPEQPHTQVERPAGFELASLVNRIIEDQAALRSDLRRERAGLARQVAAEVIDAQRSVQAAPDESSARRGLRVWAVLTVLFAVTTLVFGVQRWQLMQEASREAPQRDAANLAQTAQISELGAALRVAQTQAKSRYFRALDALQWALNQRAWSAFDELPFDDARAAELRDLLERLVAMEFRGRVRIESHLGEFCLVSDETGTIRLAAPDLPVEACTFIGHPLDESATVAARQSVGFAEFLRSSPLVNDSGIVVEVVAHDRDHSLGRVPVPADISRAGAWNQLAERNNRLEYSLIPTDG